MQRIEREQIHSAYNRIGAMAALLAAAAIAVVTVGPDVLRSVGQKGVAAGVGDVPNDPCVPGDLDCLDDRYYEENGFPFSPGTPDGCILLSDEEAVKSPLCCPHVAFDPSDCPPLLQGGADAGSNDPVDGDSTLPGGVEEPEPAPPKPPALPKSKDPFEDVGEELPG